MTKTLILCFFLIVSVFAKAQLDMSCENMYYLCLDDGVIVEIGYHDIEVDSANNYGCLDFVYDPQWLYFEITSPGIIDFQFEGESDVDFILYGPFDDLEHAKENCSNMGDSLESPIVDCSFSASPYENPHIDDVEIGEIYVLMLSNYSNMIQDFTITDSASTASTYCGDVADGFGHCYSYVGTFGVEQFGAELIPYWDPIELYLGNSYIISSNNDFVLPADTIAAPEGDGFYSARLMYLVYTGPRTGNIYTPYYLTPEEDPNYTGLMIPSQDIYDVNDADSPIVSELGYGTYYFFPITGDDGIGWNDNVANGVNDNGAVHWDLDSNGCYDIGNIAHVVKYYNVLEIADHQENTFSIYPNPMTTETTIDFSSNPEILKTVIIYNGLGQEVYRNENSIENEIKLTAEELSEGLYVISVLTDNLVVCTAKLIVE